MRNTRPLVLPKHPRRQHHQGNLAQDRQPERNHFDRADLSTTGQVLATHRGQVDQNQMPGQHGGGGGEDVMPEVDLR